MYKLDNLYSSHIQILLNMKEFLNHILLIPQVGVQIHLHFGSESEY